MGADVVSTAIARRVAALAAFVMPEERMAAGAAAMLIARRTNV